MLSWRSFALAVCFYFAAAPVAAQETRRPCGAAGVANYPINVGETVDCSMGATTIQRAEFDAVAGEIYGFHLVRVIGAGTPCITVENASGATFFTRLCGTAVSIPATGRPAVNIPSSGRYRVAVSENGTTFQTFQYHLTVERLAPPSANAPLIGPNQTIRSSINPRGDRDLYQFKLKAGNSFGFFLTRLAGSAEPTIRFVDALGAVTTLAPLTPGARLATITTSGTFAVWVQDSGDNEIFDYDIQFVCAGPDCPQPPPTTPTAFNAANGSGGLCSGAWAAITGSNFATISREWASRDFTGTRMPTSLEGVSATFGGRNASVYYVSPGQMNVIVPDLPPGDVELRVITSVGASPPKTVRINEYCPAAFQLPAERYVIALFADGRFVQSPVFLPLGSRQARPGDVISIYPTGLGQTSPAYPAGEVNPVALATRTPVRVSVGGIYGDVLYAGLISPGLYQVNFRIPLSAPAGEQPLRIEVGEAQSPEQVSLLIGR